MIRIKDEIFRAEMSKLKERYEHADNMVFRLREERQRSGISDMKKFMSLTDEINTWSSKRECAKVGMHKLRLAYANNK